ncbi:hypothetical protein SMD11_1279 [Streptomyces albireticuli]|uniref:Uncharacterized protein n=1 Tax=Streptomyces albireticuli TaxID=1940 RepID=A0A1Z2KY37_9ACTN|nr:hypothetical protein [Streptomyces albireticuli]ARZ66940.1 hypothetical protein SMD11_1279 [Streptomyces albireticuli]
MNDMAQQQREITTPVIGALRRENTTNSLVFNDAGIQVVHSYHQLSREYFVSGAPDMCDERLTFPLRPTGVKVFWTRGRGQCWKPQSAEVKGLRVLMSGRGGVQTSTLSFYAPFSECPEWVVDFIAAHAP